MKSNILSKVGAALLLLFAMLLLLMGNPPNLTPLNAAEEIGAIAYGGEDKTDPATLAEWIIAETGDFLIVDIRDPQDFMDYNISGSVNIPFQTLMTRDGIGQLPKYKKIILVYGDGTRAGQAWTVLRSKGHDVYMLDGGIKGWWDTVMTPGSVQSANPVDSNSAEYMAKIQAMRNHFSGQGDVLSAPAPQTNVPPPPAPARPAPDKKKKGGGC